MVQAVYMLSGPVASGKTTTLNAWCKRQPSLDGLLAPVIHNRRYLRHIASGESRCLEATGSETKTELTQPVGRFMFLAHTFEWGRHILMQCRKKQTVWIIIDEIGPLELQGQGLEPMVETLLDDKHLRTHTKLLLVVRQKLVGAVRDRFEKDEENWIMISKDDLHLL